VAGALSLRACPPPFADDLTIAPHVVARVFPKRGIAKVRDADIGSRDYGSVDLNSRMEWVFELDSPRFEMDQLHRSLSEQIV
jgi:hypothetical protein